MSFAPYPLRLTPIKKSLVWGSESWEICDREEGISGIDNGPYKGHSLHFLCKQFGEEVIGKGRAAPFPLLIKQIKANDTLSVQVHPDEKTAKRLHAEAKSEMWVILKADPKAFVYVGFESDTITTEDVKNHIENHSLKPLLHKIPLSEGDVISVPAGCIHAIGGGVTLYEVQQNSNTTYRLYDWGRNRPLHIKEGLKALHIEKGSPKMPPTILENSEAIKRYSLLKTDHFLIEKLLLLDAWTLLQDGKSFHTLFVKEGRVKVKGEGESFLLEKGQSALLPAQLKKTYLTPQSGQTALLLTSLP